MSKKWINVLLRYLLYGFFLISFFAPALSQSLDNYSLSSKIAESDRKIYALEQPYTSPRDSLGMFVNDTLWKGEDRWRTGSYQRSLYSRGIKDEFRFRTEYLAPATLDHPNRTNDRPYFSLVNLYYGKKLFKNDNVLSLGASVDFYNVTPIGISFHEFVHNLTGYGEVNLDGFKASPGMALNFEGSLRKQMKTPYGYSIPFLETHFGSRDMVTAGIDLVFTEFDYDFYSREQTTGNLISRAQTKNRKPKGLDLFFGSDVSWVWSDNFIERAPSKVRAEPFRYRIRTGFRYRYGNSALFIGPTYLSPEFVGQKEGQITQAISFQYNY